MYALNGGITLPFRRLILNLFAGVLGTDLFSRVLFSYGAQAQLFLPARLIVEAYLLNASYQPLQFSFLSLSLGFAVNRANLGRPEPLRRDTPDGTAGASRAVVLKAADRLVVFCPRPH